MGSKKQSPFGMIHELTNLESEMRRRLADATHQIYSARNACDDPSIQMTHIKKMLQRALGSLSELNGA